MAKHRSDIFSGLVLIGLSAALYFYLIPNFVDGNESGAMSPRFFPKLGSVLIGAGGVALTLATLAKQASGTSSPAVDVPTGSPGKPLAALFIAAAMAAFILLFQWVGYAYAAPPFVAALMVLFGARNILTIALIAAVVSAALYAVFSLGLNLPLV